MKKYIYILNKDIKDVTTVNALINDLVPLSVADYDKKTDCSSFSFDSEDYYNIAFNKLIDMKIPFYSENPVSSAEYFKILSTDKKRNMAYWDNLDEAAETFIETLFEESFDDKGRKCCLSNEDKTYLAKRTLEEVTALIKDIYDTKVTFPYVDTDY